MGSVVGTIKDAIDNLRNTGKKVGLVKIRCYRPFPHEEIWQAVKHANVIAVMDANISMGSEGAVGLDLKSKIINKPDAPMVIDFIAGLGGREINSKTITGLVDRAQQAYRSGIAMTEAEWVDLDPAILP
jgi:pyruvate ferredoxin oxidoreductase alpha subunit